MNFAIIYFKLVFSKDSLSLNCEAFAFRSVYNAVPQIYSLCFTCKFVKKLINMKRGSLPIKTTIYAVKYSLKRLAQVDRLRGYVQDRQMYFRGCLHVKVSLKYILKILILLIAYFYKPKFPYV